MTVTDNSSASAQHPAKSGGGSPAPGVARRSLSNAPFARSGPPRRIGSYIAVSGRTGNAPSNQPGQRQHHAPIAVISKITLYTLGWRRLSC